MAEDGTQQATQQAMDPRRIGRHNSGMSAEDSSDVMCILHPGSPAAFRTVAYTAANTPQHILQNQNLGRHLDDTQFAGDVLGQAEDIALRFSSSIKKRKNGFAFGRNAYESDIVLHDDPSGAARRISNTHFLIQINKNAVLVLEDISTNGTVVDDVHLYGKRPGGRASNILQNGSIIQVLSPLQEHKIIFHVRIPPRDGYEAEYKRKFSAYQKQLNFQASNPIIPSASMGMKWDGRPNYTVTGFLGKGAFANVYQLTTRYEGHHFACKELEKRRFVKDGILDRKLSNELEIMKSIKHPNIVEYIEYHDVQDHLYIIMEYVPLGDLQQYLKNGPLSEDNGILVAQQTLRALDYLHELGITHRDIKPDNILISSDNPFSIKLSDFGLSKVKKEDTFLKTFCGTLLYCAPEVFPHYQTEKTGSKRRHSGKLYSYTHAVDIWSLAGVLWNALSGHPPFEGVVDQTGRGMFERIMHTEINPSQLTKMGISYHAQDLLQKMLSTEPERRPTARQCLRHRWLDDGNVPPDPDAALGAIAEEADADEKFSQLSLYDDAPHANDSFAQFDQYLDEDDLDDINEIDFGISRSKRVKTDARYPRNQVRHNSDPESSDDLSGQDQPSVPKSSGQPSEPARGGRLFGEIGMSALEDSDVLGEQAKAALEQDAQAGAQEDRAGHDRALVLGTQAPTSSESLYGTESMVRDLNMASPPFSDSFSSPESSMNSYRETPGAQNLQIQSMSSEETPRAAPPSKHDSPDLSTPTRHGRGVLPLPVTANVSASSNISLNLLPASMTAKPLPSDVVTEWAADGMPFGTLITTMDSTYSLFVPIREYFVNYGRGSGCTFVHPDREDQRVSRTCFVLAFTADNLDAAVDQGRDWTTFPDLHVLIKNLSRTKPLWINNVELPPFKDGTNVTGALYSGDVITIFQSGGTQVGEALRFVCEFSLGEGRNRRSRPFVAVDTYAGSTTNGSR